MLTGLFEMFYSKVIAKIMLSSFFQLRLCSKRMEFEIWKTFFSFVIRFPKEMVLKFEQKM